MATFDSTYGDNPWGDITDKTRPIYVPDLLDVYRSRSFFRQFVPTAVDLLQSHAQEMYFTTMYELEPNTNPLGLRDMWLETSHTDTEQKKITMEHHGDKITLHKFDDYITQWKRKGATGLRAINRDLLAVSMQVHLDRLARNSFLRDGTFKMYGKAWDRANFNALVASAGADNFDPGISDEIFLGMQTRGMHGAVDASGSGEGTVIALTTPGVIYSIQKDTATNGWISRNQYANQQALLKYEVGSYRNVRYVSSADMTLWNAGAITVQTAVKAAIYPGSGAARNVDANREVGQATLAAGTRYVQVDNDTLTGIAVNDWVTLHRTRVNTYGVTNGVDPYDGANIYRRVVSVDNGAKRIAFDRPILSDDYSTDLGGSVFGYITKGVNVHPVVFLTGANSVVAGVTQSPQIYVPPVIDDVQAFHRLSWDAYLKYQIWNDHAVEVSFHTAPYRIKGASRY